MERIVRIVGDLNQSDRATLERVVGHALSERQRLLIEVTGLDAPTSPEIADGLSDLPDWTDVYRGLSDAEIDELDAAVRERADLTRSADSVA